MIKKNAYTLIEILVAISIFTIVIAAPTGFLVGSIKGQQKALSSQKLIDNVSYSLEYISRALRMAKKDRDGTCIEPGANYENPGHDDSSIRFLNYNNICQEFSLEDGQLKQRKSTTNSEEDLGEIFTPLTSDDLQIEMLKFELFGQEQDDNLQPRVTIVLDIKGKNTELKIQTTISQRNLDVQY